MQLFETRWGFTGSGSLLARARRPQHGRDRGEGRLVAAVALREAERVVRERFSSEKSARMATVMPAAAASSSFLLASSSAADGIGVHENPRACGKGRRKEGGILGGFYSYPSIYHLHRFESPCIAVSIKEQAV